MWALCEGLCGCAREHGAARTARWVAVLARVRALCTVHGCVVCGVCRTAPRARCVVCICARSWLQVYPAPHMCPDCNESFVLEVELVRHCKFGCATERIRERLIKRQENEQQRLQVGQPG